MSGQLKTFEPEKLIKDYFHRVEKDWPQNRAAKWARVLVQRIEHQELGVIALLSHEKMSKSLSDGERHSTGISKDNLYITISTFPCSVDEVKRIHYARGYLTYLDQMVGIARQENPRCHWLHFQFFWDGASFWVQFTLFPNKDVLDFTPMYHLPTDLLGDEERKRVSMRLTADSYQYTEQAKCMLCSTNEWQIKRDLSFIESREAGRRTYRVTTWTYSNVLLCNACDKKIKVAKILSGGKILGGAFGIMITILLVGPLNLKLPILMGIGIISGVIFGMYFLGALLASVYDEKLKVYERTIQITCQTK
jgi:hypothetical protein